MKTPPKYECLSCGYKSSKHKLLKFPGMSFAICFKCRGRVKESSAWLDWYYKQMAEWNKSRLENKRLREEKQSEKSTTAQ